MNMAQMQILDSIYNWIKDFNENYHITRFAAQCSAVAEVKASVIGAYRVDLGSASYFVMHCSRPSYCRERHLQIRERLVKYISKNGLITTI